MKVIVYFTHTCPWSSKLRTWLRRKRVKFEEWDVAEPQNKIPRDELLQKSNQLAVPLVDIDGEIIVGFDEKKIQEALLKGKK